MITDTKALWSAAILNNTDKSITYPLASAVSERFKSQSRVVAAEQFLQAHYSGLTLSDEAFKLFYGILPAHPESTTSNRQFAVSSALTPLLDEWSLSSMDLSQQTYD